MTMNTVPPRQWRAAVRVGLGAAAASCLGGCFGFLSPVKATERHFVLAPVPAEGLPKPDPRGIVVGIGTVKVPGYLLGSSFAVRNGPSEVEYSHSILWAERLDAGIQRVLAANLSSLLPTDQVRFSTWRSDDVNAEIYVTVEQFDVDTSGNAVLAAWWRIQAPGGEDLRSSFLTRLTRQGPNPDVDPAGAIGVMSELLGELSRGVADAIRGSAIAPLPKPAVGQ